MLSWRRGKAEIPLNFFPSSVSTILPFFCTARFYSPLLIASGIAFTADQQTKYSPATLTTYNLLPNEPDLSAKNGNHYLLSKLAESRYGVFQKKLSFISSSSASNFFLSFWFRLRRSDLSRSVQFRNFSRPSIYLAGDQFNSEDATWNNNIRKIRNIGIIAHIDAGKTTTSERLLYYAGVSHHLGDVDRGDTIMDYLPAERERGITIKAASINLKWKDHHIALLDTPGHVDFTQEVESSLRILDSAVLLLDAVKGVQAQTQTVYQQAQRYGVPCIAFVNKMDREGADYQLAIQSIEERLGKKTIPLQLPIFRNSKHLYTFSRDIEGEFAGVVDLVNQKYYRWSNSVSIDGKEYEEGAVELDDSLYLEMKSGRHHLIEQLADLDDELANHYIQQENIEDIKPSDINAGIRRALTANSFIPVLAGASLRNRAVQPLLDAIVEYLPSPIDINRGKIDLYLMETTKNPEKENHSNKLSPSISPIQLTCSSSSRLIAFAFKVDHDISRGALPIVFVRIYSGCLRTRDVLVNTYAPFRRARDVEGEAIWKEKSESSGPADVCSSSSLLKERVLKILKVNGEETEEVSELRAGEIGALVGLKSTFAGDSLVKEGEYPYVYMKSIATPEPVFFASLTSDSSQQEKDMMKSLQALQREDPSIHISVDEETGQTIMAGMGKKMISKEKNRKSYFHWSFPFFGLLLRELHLEVSFNRLRQGFRVPCEMGKMRVSYRETIVEPIKQSLWATINGPNSSPAIFLISSSMRTVTLNGIASTSNSDSIPLKPSSAVGSAAVDVSLSVTFAPLDEGIVVTTDSAKKMTPEEASQLMKSSHDGLGSMSSFPTSSITINSHLSNAIQQGILASLRRGPLLGYPLTNISVTLNSYYFASPLNPIILRSIAAQLVRSVLKNQREEGGIQLLEPIMTVEINVEQEDLGEVMKDLTGRRRGTIRLVKSNQIMQETARGLTKQGTLTSDSSMSASDSTSILPSSFSSFRSRSIIAEVPLTELLGYANSLRSRTGGRGSFSMAFQEYREVQPHIQQQIIETDR